MRRRRIAPAPPPPPREPSWSGATSAMAAGSSLAREEAGDAEDGDPEGGRAGRRREGRGPSSSSSPSSPSASSSRRRGPPISLADGGSDDRGDDAGGVDGRHAATGDDPFPGTKGLLARAEGRGYDGDVRADGGVGRLADDNVSYETESGGSARGGGGVVPSSEIVRLRRNLLPIHTISRGGRMHAPRIPPTLPAQLPLPIRVAKTRGERWLLLHYPRMRHMTMPTVTSTMMSSSR